MALLCLVTTHPPKATHAQIVPISATTLHVAGQNLVAGTPDGGVSLIQRSDGVRLIDIPGENDGPTNAADWYASTIWWTCAGSPTLHILRHDLRTFEDIDLGIGPLERMSEWGDYVIGYGHKEFRFVDKRTHSVFAPSRILGADLAQQCAQGQVTTSWEGDHGVFLLVRRFGKHDKATPGQIADIALVDAWDKDLKLLGGHTCNLFAFQDEPGPEVEIGSHHSPYGWTALGNLSVTDIGMVALGQDEAEAVPFGKSNWEAQHLNLPVDPNYNQSLTETEGSAWWTDGIKLFRASLEDGQTDVFLPRQLLGQIRSITADNDGAYALTASGIERIDPSLFIQYSMNDQGPGSDPHLLKLSKAMTTLDKQHADSETYVAEALKLSGVGSLKHLPTVQGEALQFGDLVTDAGVAGIYVGAGKVKYGPGYVAPIALTDQTRIVRPFGDLMADTAHGPIHNVGLGQPYISLGNSDYLQITHDTPYDEPYLPAHQQMASTIDSYLGTPYRWGGNGHGGIDCSGFVCAVFRSIGIELPRYSQNIGKAKFGTVVRDQLRYGDVLVYSWPHKHCAIYVGNGNVVEAISCGVTMHQLSGHPFGIARRFVSESAN